MGIRRYGVAQSLKSFFVNVATFKINFYITNVFRTKSIMSVANTVYSVSEKLFQNSTKRPMLMVKWSIPIIGASLVFTIAGFIYRCILD